MANILDKYGIKEVADVMFYEIDSTTGKASTPVLYLDTLKVSTIEQTADSVDAKGGKGNPPLITWDYGKEITVTLEDALFSAKSMAVMFGNGKVDTSSISSLKKTLTFRGTTIPTVFEGTRGTKYSIPSNREYFDAEGNSLGSSTPTTLVDGETYFMVFDMPIKNNSGKTIEISANSFPGTYYVTGDTYARSEISGEDEYFQFIIPKAKVTAENTITLEAEGDPSVFNLNLKVLRPAGGGAMMKLVKYDMDAMAES